MESTDMCIVSLSTYEHLLCSLALQTYEISLPVNKYKSPVSVTTYFLEHHVLCEKQYDGKYYSIP